MGGSGSHNDLVHNRGSPGDYDNWAAVTGDPSWSYENVFQYFAKSETFVGERFGNDTEGIYSSTSQVIYKLYKYSICKVQNKDQDMTLRSSRTVIYISSSVKSCMLMI
jgi:choline dehydrogenase-like flavoprotein